MAEVLRAAGLDGQEEAAPVPEPLLTAVLAPEPGEAGAGEAGRRLTEVHRACCALRELRTLEVVAEVVAAEQAAARYLTHVNVH